MKGERTVLYIVGVLVGLLITGAQLGLVYLVLDQIHASALTWFLYWALIPLSLLFSLISMELDPNNKGSMS